MTPIRARLLQEARSTSALQHANIITVHEIVNDGGTDYIVMEYVDGQTLAQKLVEGALRPAVVIRYGIATAEALCHAHATGIVHRDLKPGHIMITQSGALSVLDFGQGGSGRVRAAPVEPRGAIAANEGKPGAYPSWLSSSRTILRDTHRG